MEKPALIRKSGKSRHPAGYPGDWRPPLENRPRPRIGLLLATLAAVLLVAAISYALLIDFRNARQGVEKPPASREAAATRAPEPVVEGDDSPERGDQILECTGADGGRFYTNASSCAEADLHNRVNVVPARPAARPAVEDCLGASGPERAHLFLPQCQEAFNEALKLERFLVKAEDPLQSPRAEQYCELITQGVNAGCMATSATFCYLYLCQQRLDPQ